MKKNYLFLFILMALSATWLGADNHKLLPMNYRINEANDPQASAYPSVACQGETVFLFASGGSAYSWTGPNGFTSNISNPVISNIQLSGNGTYTVDITTDDGIVTKSVNVRVNLTQMPELPDIVGCAGSSVDGFAIPGGDNYNWIQWTNSNTDVGLAGIGQNNIPDFTMQNNTNAPINSTVSYTIAPITIPTLPLVYDYADRHHEYSNFKLNAGTNYLEVTPGQSINLTGNVNVSKVGNYCTGCIVQYYIGIGSTNTTLFCHLYSNGNLPFSDNINVNFTAPTTPGYYYISTENSLEFSCITKDFNQNPDRAIALIKVEEPAIAPNSSLSFDSGDKHIDITNIKLNNGSNVAKVSPGQSIDLSYQYNVTDLNNHFCQNYCLVQFYTGIGTTSSTIQCFDVDNIMINGTLNNTFTAPTTPGLYYIVEKSSLNYECVPQSFDNSPEMSIAMIIVQPEEFCKADTGRFKIIVNPLPTSTAASNSPICVGTTLNLTSSGGTSYNWSGPGGFTSTLQNPTRTNATAAMAGTYTVTVTNANGCSSNATTTVVVNDLPIATAGSNSPVCAGATINLTSSGGTNYSWSGPGGFTSTLQNPTRTNATAAMAGTYTVTVTNANGCSSTATTSVVVNALPIATAGSNSPVCTGSTINLTASGGTSYSWSGPGGFTSTLQNPTRTNATGAMAGTYTVTVTSSAGCSSTATTDVVVNPLPNAIAKADPNPVCSGHFAQLFAKGGVAYAWSGPGGFSSSQQNPGLGLVETNQAGTYTVTVTNNFGCSSTASVNLVVNQSPNGTASVSPQFVCVGGQAQLSASGGSTYLWRGPGGFTSTQQNPLINVTSHVQGGTYWVTISNANGCYVQLSVELSVSYPPAATATHDQSTACTGSTLKLFGSGVGTYLWTGPAGFSSTLQNPVIPNVTPANSGTYTLVVTAPGGCSATATTTVNVVAPPSLTAWADDYDVCEFSTVYLHATGAKTYEWDGPWGYYSTFQNPVLNYIPSYMTGTYSVTGTGTTGCTTTSSFDVRVYLDINGTATATPNPVPFGETVQLVATGGTSYLWTGPNGFYSTESDPTIFRFNKNNAGIYAVIISNAGGCELTLFVKVDIINPKGSRDNNVNVTSTKIVDGKIYPNPASTSITLQRNADASTVYSIIDMQGRVVVKNATTTDGRVNIEALTPGIYNVMWSQPDVVGNAFNGRFVKVK